MADLDIKLPYHEQTYTIRLATGYLSIIDDSREQPERTSRQEQSTPKEPVARARSRFTKKSQLSLQKALNELRPHCDPTHYIVLSFRGRSSENPKQWKRDISNLRRRVVSCYPASWFFWRLIPEKQRGIPVVHLLGSLGDDLSSDVLENQLNAWWQKIIGCDPRTHDGCVSVQEVTETPERLKIKMSAPEPSTHHTSFYEAWGKLGKRWDVWNRKMIPFCPVEELTITHECHHEVKRVLLDTVEKEIADIEAELGNRPEIGRFDQLRESLHAKKEFLGKLHSADDNFMFLQHEQMEFVWKLIREFNAAGE
ncbi:hypothetical protein [Salidesulfovibrio onnuriiensis]|uniref:hypothetical protein n=1 Tax=Salidesulfovibrio onnuriiensis TaxID=2583823 RepID=UPI0011CBFB19|nr:hypothetical protein [Salidesulfovibrio onnuriiensis]